MLRRCYNPKSIRYDQWGGRGIRVCDRWRNSFENFFADLGPRPSPEHTIGRINNEKDYEPGNVRWETRKEQARNKRNNRMITAYGKTLTLAEWSERSGVDYRTISYRIKSGWTPEDAIKK